MGTRVLFRFLPSSVSAPGPVSWVHPGLHLTNSGHGLLPSLPSFADLDEPVLTVHQTISDVRGSFYQEKTVFLRCTVNSNPPARFIWKRGPETLSHSQDNGVDIYEPLYTQVRWAILLVRLCALLIRAWGLLCGLLGRAYVWREKFEMLPRN